MKYGGKPEIITDINIDCKEMMFYMYLPIKFPNSEILVPERLKVFNQLIQEVLIREGTNLNDKYVYLTAKHIFASPDNVGNRAGYHSDGFGTPDINYIWTYIHSTVFCIQDFNLSTDCALSMHQMEHQADKDNEVTYPVNTLLRLDEGVIHRTPNIRLGCMRTFVKISISKEKYNLVGNSHNYLLDYDWEMFDRGKVRNHPISSEKDSI